MSFFLGSVQVDCFQANEATAPLWDIPRSHFTILFAMLWVTNEEHYNKQDVIDQNVYYYYFFKCIFCWIISPCGVSFRQWWIFIVFFLGLSVIGRENRKLQGTEKEIGSTVCSNAAQWLKIYFLLYFFSVIFPSFFLV